MDSIIMAGNLISRLPADQFIHMTKIKKIDLRLNQLHLMPTETAKFQSLEHVTHLDIRENQVIGCVLSMSVWLLEWRRKGETFPFFFLFHLSGGLITFLIAKFPALISFVVLYIKSHVNFFVFVGDEEELVVIVFLACLVPSQYQPVLCLQRLI